MKHNIKSNKGFTLVEMLGVLAIIAILISVIAVGVLSAITRARIVATTANFKNLETAVVGFVALPATGGTVPLTAGKAPGGGTGPVDTWDGTDVAIEDEAEENYTLNQALIASGLLDRSFSWRVGSDGSARINMADEVTFRISKMAFNTAGTGNPASGAGNDWTPYNRAEASAVDTTAVSNHDDPATVAISDADGMNFYLDGQTGLSANRVAYVILKGVSLKDAKKLSQEINGALDDSEEDEVIGQGRGRFIFAAPNLASDLIDCYYYLASF